MTDRRPRTADGLVFLRYSSIASFQTCHRRYYWEHVEGLEPAYFSPLDPRTWGTAIHEALQPCWSGEPDQALPLIDAHFPRREESEDEFTAWARATAAIGGYLRRWADDRDVECAPGVLVALEAPWEGPLYDSRGHVSERFALQGRLDGAWWVDGSSRRATWGEMDISTGLYVVEHKTASRIDGNYLAAVRADFQTLLYSEQAERALETPVAGVLYDVVGKTRLEHKQPETVAEFSVRREEAERAARAAELGRRLRQRKNESEEDFRSRRIAHGLAEIQKIERDLGESRAAYLARLDEHYARPEAFARIATTNDRARRLAIMDNLATVADEIDFCETTGRWPQTPRACFAPGAVCDYVSICHNNDDPRIIEQNFRVKRSTQNGLSAEPTEQLSEPGPGPELSEQPRP